MNRGRIFELLLNYLISSMSSFLELEGLHVFVTGAAGGIGSAIVDEFLGRFYSS